MKKSFSEIVTEVGNKLGRSDSTFLPIIEDAVRRRYKQVLRALNWPEKQARGNVTVTSTSDMVALPGYMEDVISIYDTSSGFPLTAISIDKIDSDHFTQQSSVVGKSRFYARERVAQWNGATTTTSSNFSVLSDAAGDTASVQIKMIESTVGSIVTATAVVNGTVGVNVVGLPLSGSFADILEFSKSVDTAGTISLRAGTTTYAQIGPQARSSRYVWIRLPYAVAQDTVLRVLYRKEMPSLDSAIDVPAVECDDILVIGAYAEALESMNHFQKALTQEAKFNSLLEGLVVEHELEGANSRGARGCMSEYRRM